MKEINERCRFFKVNTRLCSSSASIIENAKLFKAIRDHRPSSMTFTTHESVKYPKAHFALYNGELSQEKGSQAIVNERTPAPKTPQAGTLLKVQTPRP